MEYGLVALWLLAVLALSAAAFPLSAWLFRDGDAGAFALPLSLAVVTVVAHLVGHVRFGLPALLAGLAVLLALSAVAARRVTLHWRALAEPAAVFAAAYLLVVAIRAFDPAAAPLPVAIGEKFLDFGLVRSLQRSPTLPPADVWFAGETVRYYYGGHLTTALLATLTGTETRFAYNLGLAVFYGALVTTAYGLAGSIAWGHGVSRRLAAGLAAFFVGVAANLVVAAQVLAWLLPDGVVAWVVGLSGRPASAAQWSPSEFHYFDASRVIPVDPSAESTYLAATEFPLFAWINGDLHAHMMSQPFVLLAAAVLLAFWRAGDEPRRRAALLLGALPPIAGLIGVVNTWSFPTVGGLTFLAVLFAPGDPAALLPGRVRDADALAPRDHWAFVEARRLSLAAAGTAIVLALGVAWTLPYWPFVLFGGPGNSVAYWAPWTPLGNLLLVHGAFLAVFVAYLGLRAASRLEEPRLDAGIVAALALAAVAFGAPAVGLFVPLLAVSWWLLRTDADAGYETLLALAGVGLVLLVEVVTLEGERFNVIFKPYADVWLFWSVAAGAMLARLVRGLPHADLSVPDRRLRRGAIALALALVLATAPYAAIALPTHFATDRPAVAQEGPTVDATAYLEYEYADEAPAIRWLDDRPGQPTVVTAPQRGYWWNPAEGDGASAPATLSGLPTLLGWDHERQYRGEAVYADRLEDVETVYEGSPDRQAEILAAHDVRYVYVGPAERARYDVTVDEHPALTVAATFDEVTIYRVEDEEL